MKKTIIPSMLLFVFCLALTACKTREKCPAYTKINKIQITNKS